MLDVNAVLDRLRLAYGVKSDRALAAALAVRATAVANWRSRGKIPQRYLLRAVVETGDRFCISWVIAADTPLLEDGHAYVCWRERRIKIPATDEAVELLTRWARLPADARAKVVHVSGALIGTFEESLVGRDGEGEAVSKSR